MTPITWIAGGLAALVAGVAILIKGGMAEKPGVRAGAVGEHGAPEAATSSGSEGGSAGGIPLPTQTVTAQLANGEGWGSNAVVAPAVSYSSDGDGNGGSTPAPSDGTTHPALTPAVRAALVGPPPVYHDVRPSAPQPVYHPPPAIPPAVYHGPSSVPGTTLPSRPRTRVPV